MDNEQTVPQGMRESTPVERILDLAFEPSSSKQESPRFIRGECQHKHEYEKVAIDAGDGIVGGGKQYRIHTRCKICGRLQDFKGYVSEVPNGMALYELDGMMEPFLTKELGEERRVR